jgi:hypothetical protein
MSSLDRAIAYWSFGWFPSDRLPTLAVEALAQGIESPAMIELAAGQSTADERHHRLFERVLSELGRSRPTKAEAGRFIAREIAEQICQGKVSPVDGAEAIWRVSLECEDLSAELGVFGGRVSEYEGWPHGRERIAETIVADAKELLANVK